MEPERDVYVSENASWAKRRGKRDEKRAGS